MEEVRVLNHYDSTTWGQSTTLKVDPNDAKNNLTACGIHTIDTTIYSIDIDAIQSLDDVKAILSALSVHFSKNTVIYDKLPDRLKKVVK